MICRCVAWRHLDASFREAFNSRQIIDKTPSYFLKNQLHHHRLNIFQQIVWQSYVSKFLKFLEEKKFKFTQMPVRA